MRGAFLILLAAGLAAAEAVRRDVMLAVGTSPGGFAYTVDAPDGGGSGDDAFDQAWEGRLGVRWTIGRPGWRTSPLFGLDAVHVRSTYGDGGGLTALGVAATAGLAWALDDRWSLDGEAAAGWQRATLTLATGSGLSGDGGRWSLALRSRLLCALDRHWSVGIELGAERADTAISADRGREVGLVSTGWTAGAVLVWRLSSRPADLE